MKQPLEDILDRAIDRLLAGETIEDCLAAYPEAAQELEPLLRTAHAAAGAATIEPRPAFVAEARYRMRHAMSQPRHSQRRAFFGMGWRWALTLGALLLLVVTSLMIPASANALPNEPLYPVKRAQEQVVTLWFRDDAAIAGRRLELARRRLEEMESLSHHGRQIPPFLVRELMDETDLAMQHMERQWALRSELAQSLLGLSTLQQGVLAQVAPVAPPEARDSIQQAQYRAAERRQQALRLLEWMEQAPQRPVVPPIKAP